MLSHWNFWKKLQIPAGKLSSRLNHKCSLINDLDDCEAMLQQSCLCKSMVSLKSKGLKLQLLVLTHLICLEKRGDKFSVFLFTACYSTKAYNMAMRCDEWMGVWIYRSGMDNLSRSRLHEAWLIIRWATLQKKKKKSR